MGLKDSILPHASHRISLLKQFMVRAASSSTYWAISQGEAILLHKVCVKTDDPVSNT